MSVEGEQREDLIKLTVYLTPRAHRDMVAAAEIVGDTQTDTVNRAVTLYREILRAGIDGGVRDIRFQAGRDSVDQLVILVTRT